jgi:hypothetical protein
MFLGDSLILRNNLNGALGFRFYFLEVLLSCPALYLIDTIDGFSVLVRNVHDFSGIDNLHALVLDQINKHMPFLVAYQPISS